MIQVENLRVNYGTLSLFDGLSFGIESGEKIAIKGESGSGKSTLIHTLLGFVPDFTGQIFYDDLMLSETNVQVIRSMTSWVPQDLNFSVFGSIRELFYRPFELKKNKEKRPSEKEILEIFDAFELDINLLDRDIQEVSGGQKQRLALASTILLRKPYLFLDEPTSALNSEIRNKITDYLLDMENVTVIAATHDKYFMDKVDKIIDLG